MIFFEKQDRALSLVGTRPTERLSPRQNGFVGLGSGGERLIYIMFTVYVLKDSGGKLYKGMTNNLIRRLAEHRGGHTRTTSRMHHLEVVYVEDYDNFRKARKRELYLKTAAGRRFLKNKIGPVA